MCYVHRMLNFMSIVQAILCVIVRICVCYLMWPICVAIQNHLFLRRRVESKWWTIPIYRNEMERDTMNYCLFSPILGLELVAYSDFHRNNIIIVVSVNLVFVMINALKVRSRHFKFYAFVQGQKQWYFRCYYRNMTNRCTNRCT